MRPRGAGLGRGPRVGFDTLAADLLGAGRILGITAATIIGAVLSPRCAAEEFAPAASPLTVAELYRQYGPAVVRVNLAMEDLDETGQPTRLGYTGFFISHEGRILTSLHDSADVSRVWIEKDGLEYAAQYLGGDVRTHLALIQVLKMPKEFAVIPLTEATAPLPIGTEAVALTVPVELDASPSPGWITGYESEFAENIFPCAYMRTSITLGPGEAGAPVLDRHGSLAGVMVAKVRERPVFYSIPVHSLKRIVRDLAEHGTVNYGTIPIEFAESPDARYVARQVVIASVRPGSSAERAGLRPGDVLRRLALVSDRASQLPAAIATPDEAPIRRLTEVREILFHALPGEYVRIEIERDGQGIPFFSLPVESLRDAAPKPATQ